jgi:thiamine-monophosphate kinase
MQNLSRFSAGKHGPGERALIERIRRRARGAVSAELRLGIGDDCALLRPRAGEELAITTDLSIAGRHFRLDWHPPEAVGHRTLARGLSDLAAMGARPLAAFLSLGLPPELTKALHQRPAWVDRFFDGFFALADATKTSLAGGDLAQSPMAVADIVLIGAVPRGRALLRSGARPGHLLYVTGTLGGAAAGLAKLGETAAKSKKQPSIPPQMRELLAAHLYPRPRIPQGLWLQRHRLATAAIDLSDGLSTDLAHLCEESEVAAELDAARLPIHSEATLEQSLHGGEDYELLFTAPAKARVPGSIAGVMVTRIGRIARRVSGKPPITLVTSRGTEPLDSQGWEHFGGVELLGCAQTAQVAWSSELSIHGSKLSGQSFQAIHPVIEMRAFPANRWQTDLDCSDRTEQRLFITRKEAEHPL